MRPAWDNVFACQPSIFLETFSKIYLKAADLDFPKESGKPKYLEKKEILLKGKILQMLLTVKLAVFLLKWIDDLERLIDCPDQRVYDSKQELRAVAFADVAFAKRIRSSTNKRCVIGEQERAILIPPSRAWDSFPRSRRDKTSVLKINRKGDKGSPCRSPLSGENSPKGLPLMRTEKDEEEI